MGYLHIDNLYKNQSVLLLKRCYAMEKVHGTSAHVLWRKDTGQLHFFSGGCKQADFEACFDIPALTAKFGAAYAGLPIESVCVYGEAYGGKMQKMSDTYGKELRFIAFDVTLEKAWMTVPKAQKIANDLGFEFVPYREVDATVEALDAERDRPSEVAVMRGITTGAPREGVVIRPLIELCGAHGERIIAKHKGDVFAERMHPPRVVDPDKRAVLEKAEAIAEEWVTPQRLQHVLDHIDKKGEEVSIAMTGIVLKAMVEDVTREASGEIVDSKDARKAIGARAAWLFKELLKTNGGF